MVVNGVNNLASNTGLYARNTAFTGRQVPDTVIVAKEDLKSDDVQIKSQRGTKTSKVAAGVGATILASIVLGGIYWLTKGKLGNPAPKLFEKVFNDGTKVTREITDGKTIFNVFDKEGNLLKTKTKEISRSVNPQNGNKYTTIKTKTTDIKSNYTIEAETNKYYTKDGNKILQTEILRNINGTKFSDASKGRCVKDQVAITSLDRNGKRIPESKFRFSVDNTKA